MLQKLTAKRVLAWIVGIIWVVMAMLPDYTYLFNI